MLLCAALHVIIILYYDIICSVCFIVVDIATVILSLQVRLCLCAAVQCLIMPSHVAT